jgi:hypothetical protein
MWLENYQISFNIYLEPRESSRKTMSPVCLAQ